MKKINISLIKVGILFLVYFIVSCEKNNPIDGKDMSELANNPPNIFDLISIDDNTTNINISGVTFSWGASTDPDGDLVTYDVYFGTDSTSVDILVETTTNLSFNFSDRFNTCTTYYWKVIAKDGKGGSAESNSTYKFTTRTINMNNTAIVDPASFPVRFGHQTIVYDNKMWVIAGSTKDRVTANSTPYNDVYYSTDGIEWEEATNEAAFSKRFGHASITFKNKMWVIGGHEGSQVLGELKNDVWSSSDGWNWTLETANADFPGVEYHQCVVYNDKIWLFNDDDVWNSDDGINWIQINDHASFSNRNRYTVTVFNNEMWLIGGKVGFEDFRNDVWKTTDGVVWFKITNDGVFSSRFLHAATVFDDKLFVIGGQDGQVTESKNDVWFTTDGITWTTFIRDFPFKKRALHTATTYNDKIWIIAGDKTEGFFSDGGYNDVWALE